MTGLSSALSGLKINQQQIDLISNNIANVGTEGYTRKVLPQSTQIANGTSVGVMGNTIIRSVDLRLERDLWTQESTVGFYNIQSEYLSRVDNFHGAPDAGVSIASEVAKLQDSFAALANAPGDQYLLSDVVDQAVDTANKVNDLANFYSTLRNDAQDEMDTVVQNVNDLLEQIGELNSQIRFSNASGKTVASIEDARDQSIKDLSELIEVSVFPRGDGVMVVQTLEGVELVAEQPRTLYFKPTPLSASTAYPDTASGIFVGDPNKDANAIDITERKIGGHLGGLVELRDSSFPKQIAQLDELAHKMALRFDAQGLRLFTDSSGAIPADTPPDITTDPATPVGYVGFSSLMEVNGLILEDYSLVQSGTYGANLQTGSNEVIRRVIEYTFGSVEYQVASNTDAAASVDIRAAATGGTTLQDWLGISGNNQVSSTTSLSNYGSIADVITAGGPSVFGAANDTDNFILRFDDPDFGGGPYDIQIDLSAVPSTGTSAAQDMVDYVTADPNWANAVADFGAAISVGSNGELVIDSNGDIEIATSAVDPISTEGFAFVGLTTLVSEASNPYFDVAIGNSSPVRITIEPMDTEVELLAKLNAIDGLAVQIDADGFLSMRPGNSMGSSDFGGDISIIGGPFSTNSAALAGTAAGRGSIDDGVNVAQALFGTYQILGSGAVENLSPINEVDYLSETTVGSGVYVPFRSEYLGGLASTGTEIALSTTLEDFSQKIINELAQELSLVNARAEDEESLRALLDRQLVDESGVNIDEELGNLIVIQTAYSASARVISAVDELFGELMNLL